MGCISRQFESKNKVIHTSILCFGENPRRGILALLITQSYGHPNDIPQNVLHLGKSSLSGITWKHWENSQDDPQNNKLHQPVSKLVTWRLSFIWYFIIPLSFLFLYLIVCALSWIFPFSVKIQLLEQVVALKHKLWKRDQIFWMILMLVVMPL